jgi:hypothetical protein
MVRTKWLRGLCFNYRADKLRSVHIAGQALLIDHTGKLCPIYRLPITDYQ